MTDYTYKHFLLQTSAEEDETGQWSASFAIFAEDRERTLLYWMPSLFMSFDSSQRNGRRSEPVRITLISLALEARLATQPGG
jgi:hypothetical protein